MNIRNYREEDTDKLIELFQTTIHTVCRKDYTQEQLDTWAPKFIDSAKWKARLGSSYAIVAEDENKLLGFTNLTSEGVVDMFYVSADSQGLGVGKVLMNALYTQAKTLQISILKSDVSLTARLFFKSQGFVVENEYVKELNGVQFQNAIMVKVLNT